MQSGGARHTMELSAGRWRVWGEGRVRERRADGAALTVRGRCHLNPELIDPRAPRCPHYRCSQLFVQDPVSGLELPRQLKWLDWFVIDMAGTA